MKKWLGEFLRKYWMFLLVVIIFFGGWWLIGFLIDNPEDRGTFGDQFGFVNTLFSGLAFAGMIFTILLQKEELALQRKELEENREEMTKQTEQFEAQNGNLKIQRFESTFFNMLEQLQQIVNDLSIHYQEKKKVTETTTDPGTPYIEKEGFVNRNIQGRDLFRFAFMEALHCPQKGKEIKGLGRVMRIEGFSYYMDSYTPTYFDHYFRFIYTILTFIKKNEWLGSETQYSYAKMLRAILSRYELVWLFYNGLSDYGRDKLKPLIEEYTMLKNLRTDLLTICKENLVLLQEKDIVDEYTGKFELSDFEFFITDCDHKDKDKYDLKAFYREDQLQKGKEHLKAWREYLLKYGLTP